ncbi:MYG1 protein-like protein [Myriangium duriaei CBS 260.36]|uniref:MYG1 protein-like protein n=1 Tax=Myriangium duriaei CBS 260.36 TaxID=1168546 RepID=A0A9P4IW16_9PEZI|nr:MYG1 protein-like protein [Myriangium duriaei CBS 260.36]
MQTAKRMKMTGPLIGTHNGHFHADEALAVYLLRLLPEYHDSTLLRSRDPEQLNTCHTVVDVGGVYDNGQKRYDHHQREFNTAFPAHATKLSSAGLVYMHYGKDIISYCTGLSKDHSDVTLLYEKLYDDFVEAFDANDNGISVFDSADVRKSGLERKFQDKGFSIASVVNRFNYSHPTPVSLAKDSVSAGGQAPGEAAKAALEASKADRTPEQRQADEDERFLKASHFVGEQFLSELMDKFHSWLPARATVQKAFQERTQYDQSGRIMVVPHKPEGVPWSDHLYALEKEHNVEGNVLYVLFPENGEPDSKWRIRAVGVEAGGFENRKSLPDAWKGVRDEELSKVSGIPGCVFVHASGFIGGNKTFEGALEMAKKAVTL